MFVPESARSEAYADNPVPIGHGQTISQPYMVALMVELLRLDGSERVLEIGAGSGYQSAILGELALEVYSVEIVPELAERAKKIISDMRYDNVHIFTSDGSAGHPEYAPYKCIIISAAAPELPHALVDQLTDTGRIVVPIGTRQVQNLTVVEKQGEQLKIQTLTGCVFVPLVGRFGWPN
jgi:protein-L-isoaspartate(D-aspartate) O-methyltransferase